MMVPSLNYGTNLVLEVPMSESFDPALELGLSIRNLCMLVVLCFRAAIAALTTDFILSKYCRFQQLPSKAYDHIWLQLHFKSDFPHTSKFK